MIGVGSIKHSINTMFAIRVRAYFHIWTCPSRSPSTSLTPKQPKSSTSSRSVYKLHCSRSPYPRKQDIHLPNILLRSALCKSGFSSASFLRSTLAQTMKAFMGRRMRCSFACFCCWAGDILVPSEAESRGCW